MNPDLDAIDIGRQLGTDGVDSIVSKVEQYCAHEERRITLKNHPNIVSLRAEFSLLLEEEHGLEDRLESAPPPGDLRRHRHKVLYAWAVTIILTVSGFLFALLSFDPFRLGWKSYLYCLGIAVVVPFLVERLLEGCRLEKLIKALTAIAAIAGIASLMMLAVIRADLLTQQVQSAPAVVMDDAQPEAEPVNTFYSSALPLLRIATVLLSLAMEFGAGLALREAWMKPPHGSEDWAKLQEQLRLVHTRMIDLAHGVTLLEDEAQLFAARFWRDFYGSMLTHTVRSAMTKLLVLALGIVFVPHAFSQTRARLNLVVAIDLSRSVAVTGPDGTSEFQKNVDGVTRLLAQVPAGAHVTVIGITDHSFAQPYILLSATVSNESGYFGERLSAARRELVHTWKRRSATLRPSFASTDILGALELTSQIFSERPIDTDRRMLVLFSDMRNDTRELDLEDPASLAAAINRRLFEHLPDLHGVKVFALGVDGAGRTTGKWRQIEEFWQEYFARSGAALDTFSVLRGRLIVWTR
jgi:hypothetical protein